MDTGILIAIITIVLTLIGVLFAYLQWREARKHTKFAGKPSNKVKQKGENITQQNIDITSPQQSEFHIHQFGEINIHQPGDSAISKEIDQSRYREKPCPKEIIQEIMNATPYMREATRTKFIDIKVKWELSFIELERKEGNFYDLSLITSEKYPLIRCEVDITKYPEFKTMDNRDKVGVFGEISLIDSQYIELRNCYFEFDIEDLQTTKQEIQPKVIWVDMEKINLKEPITKNYQEISILETLTKPKFPMRSLSGIARETGMDKETLINKLGELINNDLVIEVPNENQGTVEYKHTRYSITPKGRKFLQEYS